MVTLPKVLSQDAFDAIEGPSDNDERARRDAIGGELAPDEREQSLELERIPVHVGDRAEAAQCRPEGRKQRRVGISAREIDGSVGKVGRGDRRIRSGGKRSNARAPSPPPGDKSTGLDDAISGGYRGWADLQGHREVTNGGERLTDAEAAALNSGLDGGGDGGRRGTADTVLS
jgi:hypothetical protein